jgi:hypothetical protein
MDCQRQKRRKEHGEDEETYRDSGKTNPSSTHVTLVVLAPISTTHALLTPAPKVAQRASCSFVRRQFLLPEGEEQGARTNLHETHLLEPDGSEQEVGHFMDVERVVEVGNEEDCGVVLFSSSGRERERGG